MLLASDVAGSGSPVVLIHGLAQRREAWDPIDLTASHTVVRVDLRGHGSSASGAPWDPFALAADVRETVRAVVGDVTPLVVGHSMGAVVATAFAASFPVRGVVALDQPLRLTDLHTWLRPHEAWLRGPDFPSFFDAPPERLFRGLAPDEQQRMAALTNADQTAVLGMWAPMLEPSRDQLDAIVDRLVAVPATVPYLAITGHDPGGDYAAWIAARMPHAAHEQWHESCHYPHLVDPARFAQRVRAFDDAAAARA